MKHWYLIWTYHDLYMKEFYKENELNMYITSLLNEYKNDPTKIYKIGFVAYWPEDNSDAIFFDGTNWTNDYPWKSDYNNDFEIDGETLNIQCYLVSSEFETVDKTWTELKQHVTDKGHHRDPKA